MCRVMCGCVGGNVQYQVLSIFTGTHIEQKEVFLTQLREKLPLVWMHFVIAAKKYKYKCLSVFFKRLHSPY